MSKIISITSNANSIYGIDKDGSLWRWCEETWAKDTNNHYPAQWRLVSKSPETN